MYTKDGTAYFARAVSYARKMFMKPGLFLASTVRPTTSLSLDDWLKLRENTVLAGRKQHLRDICRRFNLTGQPEGKSIEPGNTKGGCITVPLTSCLTGLD